MTIVLCIEEREGDYHPNDRSNIDNIMYFLYDQNKKMFDIYVKRGDLDEKYINYIKYTNYKPYSLSLNIKDTQNFIEVLTNNNSLSLVLFECNLDDYDYIDYNDSENFFYLLHTNFRYNQKYNIVAYDNEKLEKDISIKRLYSMLDILKRQY